MRANWCNHLVERKQTGTMMSRVFAALGCLSVLLATSHAAAVPTQETMVVSRLDSTTSGETSTQEVPKATEAVSEGPLLPIKLTEMEVKSDVSLRYAHTAVIAHVRNPAYRAQEATFRVLLPETAFISGFVMTLDGKSYKAYVKEKEEAKQIYQQAVSQGIGAAHVATKARDSNHFTVTVNVESNTTVLFNLTYEELLVRRNGVYNLAINLHPGALVPKLTVTVHIKETQKITDLRVPEVRTGNEIDATKDDAQNSKAVIVRSGESEAKITFTPDLEEQKRLISIYKEKSKQSSSHHNSYYRDEEYVEDTQDVLGQFVVQYDVDHTKPGEVMVNDGYFVHFFAPTDLPPLSKHVIFVLDTSGSMMGRKIEQLREAMQIILSELYSGDFFSIVEFDSSVQVHDLKEADQEPPRKSYHYFGQSSEKITLVPPSEATPENIAKAKVIVSRLDANGGTNIYSALDVATKLAQLGVGWTQRINYTERSYEVEAGEESARSIVANSTDIEATTVVPKDEGKKLEPIIVFLTDGDPTVGESRPDVIIKHLTEKNYGDKKATIFALAFGEDADRKFLRKLSLRNDGFMRHIYEAADAALQLRHFYKQVSSPLLAHVNFTYPTEQVKADSLTKRKFRSYFGGSELVVAGRIEESVTEITPSLQGWCGVIDIDDDADRQNGRKRYHHTLRVPVTPDKKSYLPLERLWSYLTIRQLLDEKDSKDETTVDKDSLPEKKALDLALKYSFVTPLTSLVVVKPNDTKAVDTQSVDEPHFESLPVSPLPAGIYGASSLMHSQGYSGASYLAAAPPGAAPLSLSAAMFEAEILDVEDYADGFGMSTFSGNMLSSSHGHTMSYQGSGAKRISAYPAFSDRSNIAPDHYRYGSQTGPSSFYQRLSPGTYDSYDTPILTTPVSTTPASTKLVPTPPSDLTPYHLERFSWTQVLLNQTADSLVMIVNGTVVTLKLTKDAEAPKRSEGDEPCTKAVDDGAGVCVYLTRCSAARNIEAFKYGEVYCSVDGYAGVCCPQDKVNSEVH